MHIPKIEGLSDEDLERLNACLPWAAFVEDSKGRQFGRPSKRSVPQQIPDRRVVLLEKSLDLSAMSVLELGCFEGIHTVALAERARRVVAVDARLENVLKTVIRCWAFDVTAEVGLWNVEESIPEHMDARCDLLFHVGVLYHLTDPVGHLQTMRSLVSDSLLLDTHVALMKDATRSYKVDGVTYRYQLQGEANRVSPFAGVGDHAKWLTEEDLLCALGNSGFGEVRVVERRDERNGPRVLLTAKKQT